VRENRTLRLTWRELETWPWGNCEPTEQSKDLDWKPSTYSARASSRPYREGGHAMPSGLTVPTSHLYRAVDKQGQTMDFLLTEQRDEQAAKRLLTKAIRRYGVPETITIDGSAANEAAIKSYNAEHGTTIAIRKIKYLNNIGNYSAGHLWYQRSA